MLKQSLLSELSRLDDAGEAMAIGVVLDQTVATNPSISTAVTVPTGQTLLITHIAIQSETLLKGLDQFSPNDQPMASPDLAVYGIDFYDAGGTTAQGTISFLAYRRCRSVFDVQDSPNWRNSPPANPVLWKPKYPIPVPSGWSVRSNIGGEFGNSVAVYGYMVSEDGARTAGYNVNPTTTDADRRYGVASATPTVGSADMIAARTGKHIRILDIHVRIQPRTAGATNKVTLSQTGGDVIFEWTNNNPVDMLELSFSPEIFLKESAALIMTGTIAGTASVNISYEYVDTNEVPGDAWWAFVSPNLPVAAGSETVGAFQSFLSRGTQVTTYYPNKTRIAQGTSTKTTPGTGYQHIVRGWCINSHKNTDVNPEQTLIAISTGSTKGSIEFAAGSIAAQTNFQISPTYSNAGHDQVLLTAVDGVNIPCKKDDGAIWVDMLATSPPNGLLSLALTPSDAANDIDEVSVTIWGKTVPNRFTSPTNRGT